jgi:hypothetical protein
MFLFYILVFIAILYYIVYQSESKVEKYEIKLTEIFGKDIMKKYKIVKSYNYYIKRVNKLCIEIGISNDKQFNMAVANIRSIEEQNS